MGSSQLDASPYRAISIASAPRRGRLVPGERLPWRGLGLLAFAAFCAVVFYVLRPGAVTDDTYAFLDWGRDLRHGVLPLLEHRTFQPLPIVSGGLLSLFGPAAPTITIMVCLAALVLLAAAAWRILALHGFGQPAPAAAALLVLVTPVLPVLALVAYNNLPFATLVLWALVFELEERPAGAWTMLILAGLTRPEAWLFLLAYGVLSWWRAGHPYAPRGWLPIAALAGGPIVVWAALEWGLFGDPLYSLHNTSGAAVQSTHTNSPEALWHTLRANVLTAPLIAAGLGALALAWLAPRRLAATTLAATLLAALSIVILAGSNFNLPGRDFSVLVALSCVLTAAGAVLPAQLMARSHRFPAPIVALVACAGAALVVGLAAPKFLHALRNNFRRISVSHATGKTFTHEVGNALPLIDVRSAPHHSVAMLGAVNNSQLAWVLGVRYNAVTEQVEPGTRLIVQPSQATWSRLSQYHLTNRTRSRLPRGWRVIANEGWQIYALDAGTPARLR
jgi:hypothetical protein